MHSQIAQMRTPIGALGQLWLSWVAPFIGAILGAVAYKAIAGTSAK